jgi:hypothetical protein
MNAIDTNLYNYLPEQWKGLYDVYAGASTDPNGKDGFAAFLASTSGGRSFLENLGSTGALPPVQLDPILNPPTVTAPTQDTGASTTGTTSTTDTSGSAASVAANTATTDGPIPTVDGNASNFLRDGWASEHTEKMDLLAVEPGMAAYLCDNPELGALFVNGSLEDAASVCGAYERTYYGAAYDPGQVDVTT